LNLGRVLGDRLRGTNNLLIQTQAEKSE